MTDGWVCQKCGASLSPQVECCPCSPPQLPLLRLTAQTALATASTRTVPQTSPQTASNGAATLDRGKVLDLEPKTSTPRPRRSYTDPDFARFWEVYPVRRDKVAAFDAWMRYVVAAGEDVDAVIAAAAAYRDAAYRDPQHSKYAQGWLSHRRWEDEAEVARPASAALSATDWEAQRAERDARIAAMETA